MFTGVFYDEHHALWSFLLQMAGHDKSREKVCMNTHIYLNLKDQGKKISQECSAGPSVCAGQPLFYAGHSTPKGNNENITAGPPPHYDSMLRIFNLHDEAWSPGHQTHGSLQRYRCSPIGKMRVNCPEVAGDSLPHAIDFTLDQGLAREAQSYGSLFYYQLEITGEGRLVTWSLSLFINTRDPPLEPGKALYKPRLACQEN